MSIYKTLPLVVTVATLLSACGSDSSNDSTQYAKVSFSVSDAPVDTMSEVVVAFDKLELKHDNGNTYIIDVDRDDEGNDYQQIDLLDYQGTDAALIITEHTLPAGVYKEMIVHTKAGDMNWVRDDDTSGEYDLKIPSNKLKLGGFEVIPEDNNTVQGFTIEFDLRQSLVERGNAGKNGYNLKPHGVKIVDNRQAASLWGTVDSALFDAIDGCEYDTGNFVYLYPEHGLGNYLLVDNYDPFDSDFDGVFPPEASISPYASAAVDQDGEYAFGYIPAGDYTVAFTCNAVDDDPIQYDSDINIANPENQRYEIILDKMKEKIFDFNL